MINSTSHSSGKRPTILVIVIALVLAALAIGCGGSNSNTGTDGSSSSTEPTGATAGSPVGKIEPSSLSKAEYIERAEEICAQGLEGLLEPILVYMRGHNKSPESEEEIAADAIHAVLVPKLQTQIDELGALGAPSGDEKEVKAFLEAMVRSMEALESRNKISLETDVDRDLAPAHEKGLDYGIQDCAG